MCGLQYWYHTGGLPQLWYFSQLHTYVEHVFHDAKQLVCVALQQPKADVIRTCSLSHLDLLQLVTHLKC